MLIGQPMADENEGIEDNYPQEIPQLTVAVKDDKLFGDFYQSPKSSSRSKSSQSTPNSGNRIMKFRKNKNSKVIPFEAEL